MRKILLLLLLLCAGMQFFGQDISIRQSVEIMKTLEQNQDANLHTGSILLEIPLYTYQDKDFEIPVSIQYVSSGYKTHASIGSLGLGWHLNAGGYITRQVKGIPDEKSVNHIAWIDNVLTSSRGKIDGYMRWHKEIFSHPNDFFSLISRIGHTLRTDTDIDYFGIRDSRFGGNFFIETEPDLFTFNFLGHRGNFKQYEGRIHIFDTTSPEGEYQVEIIDFQHEPFSRGVKIQIITGDGYKYTFKDGIPFASNQISMGHIPLYGLSSTYSTYYPLVEIEAPNGRKVIFEYNQKESNQTAHWYFSRASDWDVEGFAPSNRVQSGMVYKAELVMPISKINIDNTDIIFNYNARVHDTIDIKANPRQEENYTLLPAPSLLSSIVVKNKLHSRNNKDFHFFYHFRGNGYKNSRQVQLLKEILDFEKGYYLLDYYDENKPFPTLLRGRDYWGYSNNSPQERLPDVHWDITTNVEMIEDSPYEPDFKFARQGMLKKLMYPTGGYTKYYYEPHDYAYRLVKDLRNNQKNQSYIEQYNGIAGGVRVRRITNYANEQDSIYTDYIYSFEDGKSSGILLHTPRFFQEVPYTIIAFNQEFSETIRRASWLNDLIATEDRTHIAYSRVTKRFSDNSSTVYNFSDYRMFPDLPHSNNIIFPKRLFKFYIFILFSITLIIAKCTNASLHSFNPS